MPDRAPHAAVILGNDALVAARPCSAWQLAHACRAAGFDVVVPPTVGDELIAGVYLERLRHNRTPVVVASHCPRARTLLSDHRTGGIVRTIHVVAPPVAAARAVRLTYGASTLVTYVGMCPAADDPSINARFSPSGFLASLDRQGIVIRAQPDAMPASDADRWRRYLSTPGGLPALRWLARPPVDRVLREVDAADVDVARWTGSRSMILLDVAESAGCACAGDRMRLEEYEPARASRPTIVAPTGLALSDEQPAVVVEGPARDAARATSSGRSATDGTLGARAAPARSVTAAPVPTGHDVPARLTPRQTPPAAHAASRNTSGNGVVTPPDIFIGAGSPAARANDVASALHQRRALLLLLVPVVVLAATAALGAAVYAIASRVVHRTTVSGESIGRSAVTADSVETPVGPVLTAPAAVTDTSVTARPAPVAARAESTSVAPIAPGAVSSSDSGAAPPNSLPKQLIRRRRVEVVPGWLPQGRPAFTPADTTKAQPRDSSAAKPKRDTIPRA